MSKGTVYPYFDGTETLFRERRRPRWRPMSGKLLMALYRWWGVAGLA